MGQKMNKVNISATLLFLIDSSMMSTTIDQMENLESQAIDGNYCEKLE